MEWEGMGKGGWEGSKEVGYSLFEFVECVDLRVERPRPNEEVDVAADLGEHV